MKALHGSRLRGPDKPPAGDGSDSGNEPEPEDPLIVWEDLEKSNVPDTESRSRHR